MAPKRFHRFFEETGRRNDESDRSDLLLADSVGAGDIATQGTWYY
jgi:hypothetical protein